MKSRFSHDSKYSYGNQSVNSDRQNQIPVNSTKIKVKPYRELGVDEIVEMKDFNGSQSPDNEVSYGDSDMIAACALNTKKWENNVYHNSSSASYWWI